MRGGGPVSPYTGKNGKPWFDVKRYGAKGDGVTDDTAAISAAISAAIAAAASPAGATVFFPAGKFLVTDALPTITAHRVNVLGTGPQSSAILFNPTAAKTCFKFQLVAASILVQCSLKGLGFTSTDVTYKKIAVNLVDTDIFTLEDVAVNSWTGATSNALLLNGRDALSVSRIQFTADLPIDIGINPNSTITLDHAHFEDVYLIASGNPCVRVADGAALTQVTFDGVQAWVAGTYGLYWLDTTSAIVSQGLTIKNLRTESGSDATAYSIYISHNTNLQDLKLENCLLDSSRKGIYWRKINRVTLDHVVYPSVTKEGLNGSAVSDQTLNLIDCFFQAGSTVSLTNFVQRMAIQKVATTSPIPDTCFWAFDFGVTTQGKTQFWNSNYWSWSGQIANGGVKGIPASNNAGRLAAMIFIIGTDGTGVRREGGMAVDDGNALVVLSGSANFVTGNVAGKLCILHGGGTDIINNLGATCYVTVFVIWQ